MKIQVSVISALFFTCSFDDTAGTVDDTDTGTIISLYNPDGSPAKGAIVAMFIAGDTARTPVFMGMTDGKGAVSLQTLKLGLYNFWAYKDTLVAYQDSVRFMENSTDMAEQDTLGSTGSITCIAGVQPSGDPRSVTAQILGSEKYRNADENGRFTFGMLPRGSYEIRLSSVLPDYVPTYYTIRVQKNGPDTLKDTLRLIHTGIPVVTGLCARCDTLNGTVRLSWYKTKYGNIQDYVIYRDFFDSVNMSDKPVANVLDTTFVDTIFSGKLASGPFSFSDTNFYRYKYRVAVRTNSQIIGLTYKYDSVVAAPPVLVTTVFTHSIWHIAKQMETQIASINDSLRFVATFFNRTRGYTSFHWAICRPDSVIKSAMLDSIKTKGADTIVFSFPTNRCYFVYASVRDIAGMTWNDTIHISLVPDPPSVDVGADIVTTAGTIQTLHCSAADTYGTIVRYEWGIAEKGNPITFSQTSTPDTTFVVHQAASLIACCRVTDDDSMTACDSLEIKIIPPPVTLAVDSIVGTYAYLRWSKTTINDFKNYSLFCSLDSNAFSSTGIQLSFPYDTTYILDTLKCDTVYYFQVVVYDSTGLYSSSKIERGSTYTMWSQKAPIPTKRSSMASCEALGKIYVFGGITADTQCTKTVEAYDPSSNTWETVNPMLTARKSAVACCIIEGKIYVIGGCRGDGTCLTAVEMYDPVADTWTYRAPLPFAAPAYPSSAGNNTITVIIDNETSVFRCTYDVALDKWTSTKIVDIAPTQTKNLYITMCNNHLLKIAYEGNETSYFNFYEYDFSIGAWKSTPQLKHQIRVADRSEFLTYRLCNYISGSSQQYEYIQVYDPYTESWNTWRRADPDQRAGASACFLNGKLYLIGGYTNAAGIFTQQNTVIEYSIK